MASAMERAMLKARGTGTALPINLYCSALSNGQHERWRERDLRRDRPTVQSVRERVIVVEALRPRDLPHAHETMLFGM